jgi:hypothetical protein
MLTPMMGNVVDLSRAIWAADTGCFSAPEKYDEGAYLAWLAVRPPQRCLFATAPDVVGDAEATLAKSLPVLPKIRALGYRAALVAQDGLEGMAVPWDAFDAMFIGGTTHWKLSEVAYGLAREADERGKWVHMGRVNSWRRLKAAAVSGYDSADGTYLKFGPDVLWPRLSAWMETLQRSPRLGET